jgi:hypothetical protein
MFRLLLKNHLFLRNQNYLMCHLFDLILMYQQHLSYLLYHLNLMNLNFHLFLKFDLILMYQLLHLNLQYL